jgi:hypothetical protein
MPSAEAPDCAALHASRKLRSGEHVLAALCPAKCRNGGAAKPAPLTSSSSELRPAVQAA